MFNVRLTSNVCLQAGGAPGVMETRTGAPGDLLEDLTEGEAAFLVRMHMGVIEGGGTLGRPVRIVSEPMARLPKRGSKRRRR